MIASRRIGLLCLLGVAAVLACNRTSKNEVRFDGLYCSKTRPKSGPGTHLKEGESVPQFYRFYSNGTFVHSAALGEPQDVAKWIKPKLGGLTPDEGDGVYSIQGNQVKLEFPKHPAHNPASGTWLEWVGTFVGEEIEMEWFENTTNPPARTSLRKERLAFYPVQFGHN